MLLASAARTAVQPREEARLGRVLGQELQVLTGELEQTSSGQSSKQARQHVAGQGGVEKHRVRAEARVSQGHFRTGTYGLWTSLSRIPTTSPPLWGGVAWLGGTHNRWH